MRVQNNVMALNAWRNLFSTTSGLTKSMEKLSSGYRINRAGDDAAGLAISEKMRGQIAGLNMAAKNAQDGISLIQTAEGALGEVHAMLTRMEELAVQSANDSNTSTDRAKLQSEMDQLAREIARIGGTTEFNTMALLDGTFADKDIVFHIGANEGQNLRIRIGDMRSHALGITGLGSAVGAATYTESNVAGTSVLGTEITAGTYRIEEDPATAGQYNLVASDGTIVATSTDGLSFATGGTDQLDFTEAVTAGTLTIETSDFSDPTSTTSVTSASLSFAVSGDNGGLEAGAYKITGTTGAWVMTDQNGQTVAVSTDDTTFNDLSGNPLLTLNHSLTGTTQTEFALSIGGIDISTQAAADQALVSIRGTLESVSEQRSLFGATQNRLEHTINNLQVAAENLSAAESRIRDVDMASEMATFTKHQILLQAGTAMLSQANAAPQSVLQLLG